MNIQNNEDDFNSISQEFFSEKKDEHSDKTIVSWIINGFFSGFSIRDDQYQITDANNSSTYCCVI
jgi:glutathionylspermidine synthase